MTWQQVINEISADEVDLRAEAYAVINDKQVKIQFFWPNTGNENMPEGLYLKET